MERININLINEQYRPIVFELMFQLKNHSQESFEHSIDVAEKALLIAKAFGVAPSEHELIYTASLLHDIGKLHVDPELLHHPNATHEELEIIRTTHIEGSKTILSNLFDENIIKLATHHHERLNRSGYPEHLKAKQISLFDRILQVADVTSALSLPRSYQEAKSPEVVVAILEKLAETHELDISCVKKMKDILLNQNKNESGSGGFDPN